MANEVSIIIRAKDQASQEIRKVSGALDGTADSAKRSTGVVGRVRDSWGSFTVAAAGAGVATGSLVGAIGETIGAANRSHAALTGLNSVARAFGQDAGAAKSAAQSLASDGLMTVADAATGLKNLLAAGFSLDQATTLMGRFKDSAAFGRQGALDFGQAIVGATEGIKNGNSILVDNAGVTKNLSMMLEEAGFSAQDLMKATSDGSVRQAIFNGILKETNPQLGDAAKLADSFAGKQAQAAAQTEKLKQNLGTAVQGALLPFLEAVTPVIVAVSGWIAENQKLAAGIAIAVVAFFGIITVVGLVAAAFALFSAGAVLAVGVVAAGIAIAAAAIIMSWDAVKNFFVGIPGFFSNLWSMVTTAFSTGVSAAVAWFKNLPNTIAWGLGWLLGRFVSFVVVDVPNFINGVINWFRQLPGRIGSAISSMWSSAVGHFNNFKNNGKTWALDTVNSIIDYFKGLPGKLTKAVGDAFNAAKSKGGELWGSFKGGFTAGFGHRAAGGPVAANTPYIVGERGQELFVPDQAGTIIPADRTRQMLSQGGSGGVTNNIYGNITLGDSSAVDRFFERLDRSGQLAGMGLASP